MEPNDIQDKLTNEGSDQDLKERAEDAEDAQVKHPSPPVAGETPKEANQDIQNNLSKSVAFMV